MPPTLGGDIQIQTGMCPATLGLLFAPITHLRGCQSLAPPILSKDTGSRPSNDVPLYISFSKDLALDISLPNDPALDISLPNDPALDIR